ncbi:hypothetical protein RN001_006514 [Aquatica leii]|uniref:DUF7869 domain-containing protein n=1 Tax=Aquatica leii TaxID=1421715 RepID=A0AAN7P869_9COLE|nr:hypothetical protein RN001_006514 [Aquatica leii]
MYLYTENFATKGSNEVISCLNHYINTHKTAEQSSLTIFCDNCFSQNKNRFMPAYLDSLCAKRMFAEIKIQYPILGHTIMPIDRCFASIEKRRLKTETIHNPEYYVKLIKESRKENPFEVVFVQHSLLSNPNLYTDIEIIPVLDYKDFYVNRLKPQVPGISKIRSVLFSHISKPMSRDTMTGDYTTMIALYKIGNATSISRTQTRRRMLRFRC